MPGRVPVVSHGITRSPVCLQYPLTLTQPARVRSPVSWCGDPRAGPRRALLEGCGAAPSQLPSGTQLLQRHYTRLRHSGQWHHDISFLAVFLREVPYVSAGLMHGILLFSYLFLSVRWRKQWPMSLRSMVTIVVNLLHSLNGSNIDLLSSKQYMFALFTFSCSTLFVVFEYHLINMNI